METSRKQLSFAFVIICLSFIWTLFRMEILRKKNEDLKKENIEMKKDVDSLANEIFVSELKLFRYEKAIEIFQERNPVATSQLSDIISDETE
jgi:hypothetical protein